MSEVDKVKAFMINKSNVDRLFSLRNRWENEKKYEDWADYENEMKKLWGEGFLRGTKRPFGLHVMEGKIDFHIKLKLTRTTVGMTATY